MERLPYEISAKIATYLTTSEIKTLRYTCRYCFNIPAMNIEFLPMEIGLKIASYLTNRDAISLSKSSKYCYTISLDRIWNTPNLREIFPHELKRLSHLPIKYLNSKDLQYVDLKVLKKIPTLREFIISDDILTESEVRDYARYHFKVVINAACFFSHMENALKYVDNCEIIISEDFEAGRGVRYLELFEGSKIRYLDTKSLCIHDEDKDAMLQILQTYDISEIRISAACTRSFTLTKKDVTLLKDCNITLISTIILYDNDFEMPWYELTSIKTLRAIYFEYGTRVSTKRLRDVKINRFGIFSSKLLHGTLESILKYLLKCKIISLTATPNTYIVCIAFFGYIENQPCFQSLDRIKI